MKSMKLKSRGHLFLMASLLSLWAFSQVKAYDEIETEEDETVTFQETGNLAGKVTIKTYPGTIPVGRGIKVPPILPLPYATQFAVAKQDSAGKLIPVRLVRSNAEGNYQVLLPAGKYLVTDAWRVFPEVTSVSHIRLSKPGQVEFSVKVGETTKIDLEFIRMMP
jgi:hypothetical protein